MFGRFLDLKYKGELLPILPFAFLVQVWRPKLGLRLSMMALTRLDVVLAGRVGNLMAISLFCFVVFRLFSSFGGASGWLAFIGYNVGDWRCDRVGSDAWNVFVDVGVLCCQFPLDTCLALIHEGHWGNPTCI